MGRKKTKYNTQNTTYMPRCIEINVGVEKVHNRWLDRPGMQHLMLPM